MSLIEREMEQERRRRQESERQFGHPGASIAEFPGLDWRSEALTLEAQLAGVVAALRESAETLHRVSSWWEHAERSFEDCPAASCVKARAALGGQ